MKPIDKIIAKVVLIGDSNVGKTNVVSRFINRAPPKEDHSTIGVEFGCKDCELSNGCLIRASIWDTAGQERYKAITSAHYRRAAGALIVYDVTVLSSFHHVDSWLHELRTKAGKDVPIVLVGNKIDLVQDDPNCRRVSYEEAKHFADIHGLLFIETSAKTNTNIDLAFESLLTSISENYMNNKLVQAEQTHRKIKKVHSNQLGDCCSDFLFGV